MAGPHQGPHSITSTGTQAPNYAPLSVDVQVGSGISQICDRKTTREFGGAWAMSASLAAFRTFVSILTHRMWGSVLVMGALSALTTALKSLSKRPSGSWVRSGMVTRFSYMKSQLKARSEGTSIRCTVGLVGEVSS